MNKLTTVLASLTLIATAHQSWAVDPTNPNAPTLAQALKLVQPNAVVFRPTRMSADSSLNVSHIKLGDGSVKPGQKGVMLVVYSSTGDNPVLFSDFHTLGKTSSPVLNFLPFHGRVNAPGAVDQQGRVGIIAILIGYQLNPRTNSFVPAALPSLDTISAEVNPDDAALIGLLLPAVQKVRSAAAR